MGAEDLRFGLNPGKYPAPVRRQLEIAGIVIGASSCAEACLWSSC